MASLEMSCLFIVALTFVGIVFITLFLQYPGQILLIIGAVLAIYVIIEEIKRSSKR